MGIFYPKKVKLPKANKKHLNNKGVSVCLQLFIPLSSNYAGAKYLMTLEVIA